MLEKFRWLESQLISSAIIVVAFSLLWFGFGSFYPPTPLIHDELSYFLAADTFLHGALANPTPESWQHFETFHINMHPTYASKYMPLQGLTLAFGKLLFGSEAAGVAIVMILALVALNWALRAWLNSISAFIATLFVAVHGELLCAWGLTFWGGGVALLGGSLLYGAIPRAIRTSNLSNGFWLGLGISILALSRPYEGIVASIPACLYLGYYLFFNRSSLNNSNIAKTFAITTLILTLSISFLAFYNTRVTGNAFEFPYAVNSDRYFENPPLLLQDPVSPREPRNEYMDDFYEHAKTFYDSRRSVRGFLIGSISKILLYWGILIGIGLSVFLVGLPGALRKRETLFPFCSSLFFIASLSVIVYEAAHYSAPFLPMFCVVIASSLERLWGWSGKLKNIGKTLVIGGLIFAVAHNFYDGINLFEQRSKFITNQRLKIENDLSNSGERHLILVRYNPKESEQEYFEFVYNSANIKEQSVIWARDLGIERNAELFRNYPNRQHWLFEVNKENPKIRKLN